MPLSSGRPASALRIDRDRPDYGLRDSGRSRQLYSGHVASACSACRLHRTLPAFPRRQAPVRRQLDSRDQARRLPAHGAPGPGGHRLITRGGHDWSGRFLEPYSSSLIPEAFTISPMRGISCLMNAANVSGVLCSSSSRPNCVTLLLNSGSDNTLATSECTLRTISLGVPAGDRIPN
jgi:hypothetical protein